MSFPTSNHLLPAKCILRYLQGTIHQGLAFTPGPLILSAYSDANWASDPMDRKSISKYRVLASSVVELCWIRMLLKNFGVFLQNPPILWCDNFSTLALPLILFFMLGPSI